MTLSLLENVLILIFDVWLVDLVYMVLLWVQERKELFLKFTGYGQTMKETQTFSRWRHENYALCVHRANGYTFLPFPWKKSLNQTKSYLKLFQMHLNSLTLSWKISGNDFSVWKYLNARNYSSVQNIYFFKFSWGLSFMWDL